MSDFEEKPIPTDQQVKEVVQLISERWLAEPKKHVHPPEWLKSPMGLVAAQIVLDWDDLRRVAHLANIGEEELYKLAKESAAVTLWSFCHFFMEMERRGFDLADRPCIGNEH